MFVKKYSVLCQKKNENLKFAFNVVMSIRFASKLLNIKSFIFAPYISTFLTLWCTVMMVITELLKKQN